MTKAAIVTQYFLPVKGGIEVHSLNLAKKLKSKGLDVELHTSEDTYLNRHALKQYEIVDELKVYRHPHFYYSVFKYLKYDVVHLHNFNVLPHSLILVLIGMRRSLGMSTPRIIITTHGGFNPHWDDFSAKHSVIKKLYNKTAGIFFLNHVADKIIAVSQWEYRALTNSGIKAEKIALIPNGVEDEAYSAPSPSNETVNSIKPYVCYIGRMARNKNFEFMIESIKDLNVNLVIAGQVMETEYYHYIINLINKSSARDRIFYYGEVDAKTKYALIDNAVAICLTSKHEAEGIIIKEAMARGKPVIVSDIESLRLLVNNYENGFVVADQDDLKKCVNELLTDRKLCEKIAINNRTLSLQWEWSLIADCVLDVYGSS